MTNTKPLIDKLAMALATLDLGDLFEHPCFQQFAHLAQSNPTHFSQANGVKISVGKTCGYYTDLYQAKIDMANLQGVPESELGGLHQQLKYSQENPDHHAVYAFLNCTGQTAQLFFGVSQNLGEINLVHTTIQQMSREAFDEVIGRS